MDKLADHQTQNETEQRIITETPNRDQSRGETEEPESVSETVHECANGSTDEDEDDVLTHTDANYYG